MRVMHISPVSIGSLILILSASLEAQTVVARWNFNSQPADGSPSTGTLSPSIGSGVASLVGTTSSFADGAGSSDPATADDSGWSTTSYGNNTSAGRGVEFAISTVGLSSASFGGFVFSYDVRHSDTASRYEQVFYSVNGATWNAAGTYFDGNVGSTWFLQRTVTITDMAAFDNPSLTFRILSSNGPGAVLVASNSTSTFNGSGTWRFDMVSLTTSALPVPEPGAAATWTALVAFGGAMIRRRRVRRG